MNTAIYGYGTMGKFLVESVNKYEGMNLAGVVDDFKDFDEEFVYKTFEDVPNKIDVIIDFYLDASSNIVRIIINDDGNNFTLDLNKTKGEWKKELFKRLKMEKFCRKI